MAMKSKYTYLSNQATRIFIQFNPFVCPLNFAAHRLYIIYSNSVSIISAISIHLQRSFKSFKFQSRASHDHPKSYQFIRVFCWCREKKAKPGCGFSSLHQVYVIQNTHHQGPKPNGKIAETSVPLQWALRVLSHRSKNEVLIVTSWKLHLNSKIQSR